jgi:hypothetical protein
LADFFQVSELTAWRTRRRLVPLLRQCRHIDLALPRRRLTPRLAWRLARQVSEFRHFLSTFAQWARGPQPQAECADESGLALSPVADELPPGN